MKTVERSDRPGHGPGAAALTVGFGTTVAMWAVGYLGHLPGLRAPGPLLLALLLACLVGGGVALGRSTGRGFGAGAAAGLVAGLLNLLVLGSLLTGDEPNRVVPSALWWVPGSLVLSALLSGAGAAVGGRLASGEPEARNWSGAFAKVAAAATLLLLFVGGLVTSAQAGMAVIDWPSSFGYNMFLYPLSKMTGGIYYEHAHRLIGALVGLTTLVLAIFLQRVEPRRWVRAVAWVALGLVVVQGALGGLRVTEVSLGLAMLHGIVAQLFFGTLVALAAFTSAAWREAPAGPRRASAGTDRTLTALLVAVLLAQLVLGAAQRHLQAMLLVHITIGVAVVMPLALLAGVRAWGLNRGSRLLQRLGLGLVAAVALQVLLGLGAYVANGAAERGLEARSLDLAVSTAHQWFGAVVLALAVLLACWTRRS